MILDRGRTLLSTQCLRTGLTVSSPCIFVLLFGIYSIGHEDFKTKVSIRSNREQLSGNVLVTPCHNKHLWIFYQVSEFARIPLVKDIHERPRCALRRSN